MDHEAAMVSKGHRHAQRSWQQQAEQQQKSWISVRHCVPLNGGREEGKLQWVANHIELFAKNDPPR